MKGRAVTDEQKRTILDRLLRLWCQHPELRLGQLVENVATGQGNFYFVEDEELLTQLEAFYEKFGIQK